MCKMIRYGAIDASESAFPFKEFFVKKLYYVQEELTPFRGGESEALRRLRESLSDKV